MVRVQIGDGILRARTETRSTELWLMLGLCLTPLTATSKVLKYIGCELLCPLKKLNFCLLIAENALSMLKMPLSVENTPWLLKMPPNLRKMSRYLLSPEHSCIYALNVENTFCPTFLVWGTGFYDFDSLLTLPEWLSLVH
jgi:hypothetical protein